MESTTGAGGSEAHRVKAKKVYADWDQLPDITVS